jgi:ribonuclease HI
MAKKVKYYVVWKGRKTGIFHSWEECKELVDGFEGAKYKSFESKEEATAALLQGANKSLFVNNKTNVAVTKQKIARSAIIKQSICVDAACSGNPGKMEYRGVDTQRGIELFHQGPYPDATNNIGEFLAIVHGLAYLQQRKLYDTPIYTDSRNAMIWVKAKVCRTKLEPTKYNGEVFELISRAENWLKNNTYKNPIIKWETEDWGEIPADFGRK